MLFSGDLHLSVSVNLILVLILLILILDLFLNKHPDPLPFNVLLVIMVQIFVNNREVPLHVSEISHSHIIFVLVVELGTLRVVFHGAVFVRSESFHKNFWWAHFVFGALILNLL